MFDAFAWDTGSGVEAWTVEDGGRIRHRDPSDGSWEFQEVPAGVKDTLHRVMFLTSGSQAGELGWAVGQGGWVLGWDAINDEWAVLAHIATQLTGGTDPDEELYDVHFVDADDGWLAGKHSLWWSDNGGIDWTKADIWDPGSSSFLDLADYELYALDVVDRGSSRLGLAVMEPGIVLRSTSAAYGEHLETWEVVFDIRDLCPSGGDVEDCQNATGGILKGCECEVCAPSQVGGPHFEPWDVEISRHATQPLALFTGGIVFQCGLMFASTDDGSTWTKEWHECTCTGSGCIDCESQLYFDLYHDDPQDPDDLTRHTSFKTLYGLGIQDGNNSAIAAGYNGQLIVRDPATGVWKDRSIFSPAIPTTEGCVKYPMSGAEALAGSWTPSSGTGFGIVTGMGGHILETEDGGDTYDIDFEVHGEANVIGEPHRTHSLSFHSYASGWQAGQLFRIAFSDSQGVRWSEQEPSPTVAIDQKCLAIAFAPDGQVGVAVGERITDFVEDVTHPIIRYTNNGGTTNGWQDPSISVSPAYGDNDLVEATWAPGDKFWAVGTGGLILYSTNDGASWSQFVPSGQAGTNQPYFQIEGATFPDATNGVFVGVRPEQITSGALRGVAFHNQNANPASWNSIAMPSGLTITGLFDVAWGQTQSATSVWAVGEKLDNDVINGTVLRADWSGSSFGTFTEVHEVPDCLTGGELEESRVLTEVEVAPITGDVWVGGKCGRVWVGRSGSTNWGQWDEVKSMTSAHVTDISFVMDSQNEPVGYVNGFRTGPLQQCIVRVRD